MYSTKSLSQRDLRTKEEASRFAPHADNMIFNTHDKERISIRIILPVYFYTSYAIKNIGGKVRPGRDADPSLPSSAEVKE